MENVKVIVLQGLANSGKTTTLNTLIGLFPKAKKHDSNRLSKDTRVTVELNGKQIGIITAGDNVGELEHGFSALQECEIYVCAARTKGGTVDYLENKFKEEDILWIGRWQVREKTFEGTNVEERRKRANQCQAKEIYDILNELTKCNPNE